ncbi:hypothetical protein ACF073_00820 [Streptomyces sp. NPDC015171]|uniref:hypothetical protein n=1 Tax=Streptomyces sp. NPDC015171 TaxID=3364945 RepID=UPI0036FB6534
MGSERSVCPVCGQAVETVVKRHKTLGAWVPVWGPGPCHNPSCKARADIGRSADSRRSVNPGRRSGEAGRSVGGAARTGDGGPEDPSATGAGDGAG